MRRAEGRRLTALLLPVLLAGCGGAAIRDSAPEPSDIDFSRIPDAVPQPEPRSRYGNPASYEVYGKRYRVLDSAQGFVQRGVASWYGTKFHGRRTSSGEVYDMYRMTAAHKTLPLPTYVRVTNLLTGRSVVVKVNDRGPFHDDRIIDLSYAAARKLQITGNGTALVEIRALDPARPEPPAPKRVKAVAADAEALAATGGESGVEVTPVSGTASATAPVANVSPATLGAAARIPPAEAIPAATDTGGVFLQLGAFSDRTNAERLRERIAESVAPISILPGETAEQPLYRVRIGPLASVQEADALAEKLSAMGITPRVVRD